MGETVKDMLVRQGLANAKPVGAGRVRGMKGPGAASDGAHGGVAADDPEGGRSHPPIGRPGGARQPMGNSGKGPRVNASAKFTGLRIVIDNSRNWRIQAPRVAPLGVRQFLVLVQ
jgi:hypothetical protein